MVRKTEKLMANKICILSEEVINRISAGEVVERPASVVKELVENSIDAGAAKIAVEVRKGGSDLIKVTDNGCGMTEKDALISLERHSTSKIKNADEIENIKTLGFRGEALPSIAAVSRMILVTRPQTEESGVRIEIEGGKIKGVKKTGCPAGTSIEVEQLFFNTPARRKFLKTVPTEIGHITNILSHEALARSKTSFELVHNGKLLINVPAGKELLERVLYLYGSDLKKELVPFDGKTEWLEIHGLSGKPECARSQARFMIFFVNGRPVKSRLLSHAVMDGYYPLLERGRFPVIFLFAEIAAEMIDVNVHPQKSEVKFQKTNVVHSFVSQIIKDSMGKGIIHTGFSGEVPVETEREKGIKEAVGKYFAGEQKLPEYKYKQAVFDKTEVPGEISVGKERIGDYVPVAQLHNTYIAAEAGNSIMLIDQHAAHERILYERIKEEFKKTNFASQRLLLPFTIEVSLAGTALIEEKLDVFNSAGFDIEHFGENSFRLRAVPALLKYTEPRRLFLDMVDDLLEIGETKDPADFREKMIAIMACRGAVKAGDKLGQDEMDSLLRDLSNTKSPYFCPHGRPTIIELTISELEKRFHRR